LVSSCSSFDLRDEEEIAADPLHLQFEVYEF